MELPDADHELTDTEILDQYGALMAEGISAFRTDPEFVVSMAERAAEVKAKRASRREWEERRKTDT